MARTSNRGNYPTHFPKKAVTEEEPDMTAEERERVAAGRGDAGAQARYSVAVGAAFSDLMHGGPVVAGGAQQGKDQHEDEERNKSYLPDVRLFLDGLTRGPQARAFSFCSKF